MADWLEEGALPGKWILTFQGVNSDALERIEVENFQRGLSAPAADDPGGTAYATGRSRGMAMTPRQGLGVVLAVILAFSGYSLGDSLGVDDGVKFALTAGGFVVGLAAIPLGFFLLQRRATVRGVIMTEPWSQLGTPKTSARPARSTADVSSQPGTLRPSVSAHPIVNGRTPVAGPHLWGFCGSGRTPARPRGVRPRRGRGAVRAPYVNELGQRLATHSRREAPPASRATPARSTARVSQLTPDAKDRPRLARRRPEAPPRPSVGGIVDGIEIQAAPDAVCVIRQGGGVRCALTTNGFNFWDAIGISTPARKITPQLIFEANGAVSYWNYPQLLKVHGFEGP